MKHRPPFLPDFQMTSLVRKLNSRGKHLSLLAGMREKSHTSVPLQPQMPLMALVGLALAPGQPGRLAVSSTGSLSGQTCASAGFSPYMQPPGHIRLSPPGKKICSLQTHFFIVFLPERQFFVLESFCVGATSVCCWRQRLPFPGHKGRKKCVGVCMYIF